MILAFTKYLHGMDSYERHKAVADIIDKSPCNSKSILDVGGETKITTNRLAYFLRNRNVMTANVITKTGLQVSGVELPIEDKSCDAVVSIDTLEHIPKKDREKAISEYYRIATKEVILTGPIDNEYQRNSEKRVNEAYKKLFGRDHHYLIEHLNYGDPSIEDLKRWCEGKEHTIVYLSDNTVIEKHIEKSFSFFPKIKPLNKIFKLLYTAYTIKDYAPIEYINTPKPVTRRFLVHIKL
ncbi:MAG: methyltransferase domain-containing protein [FCB group bacterium]|nr:methyltransferase domain-containing protein [FCB group bacterium]